MGIDSPRMFFFLFAILITIANLTTAQPNILYSTCSNSNGNYTNGSTYQTNLNTLLSSFSSNNEIDYGFYNFSQGQTNDMVNAIALCRGDVAPDACHSCVNDSAHELLQLCPIQKEAVVWYDICMLRYSNRSILGATELFPMFYMCNQNNASDVVGFNQALRTLLDGLRDTATSGDSLRKFAVGNTSATNFQTIYALVQCTPDLRLIDCNNCLVNIIGRIPDCCPGKQGGRVVSPSCNFRYESYLFYNENNVPTPSLPPSSTPSPPPPPPPPPPLLSASGESSITSRTVIVIVVPIVAVLLLVICTCIFLKRRKSRERVESELVSEAVEEIGQAESLQYDFVTIRVATHNFSDANKLGQGGFGAVYRGFLSNGQEIAVKRLSMDSGQGNLEFKNEVLLLAKLQHRNLVRLLGFCLGGNEKLLIYEFVPNASLDHFLFDPIKRTHLDWEIRYKIIGGIVKGILYLHEDSRLRIIHRDLKASNILLDAEMNPKISDFGMAKLVGVDQTHGDTSRIVGTYGYMAPEYAMHGQFSVKSDVFSFGVLVLEIVSGQKNSCFGNGENVEDLLSCAWKNWREGTALNIIDSNLSGASRTEMMRCIHIGLLCVQENVEDRPNMASIVLLLNSYSITLPTPAQPAFFMHSNIESDMSSMKSVKRSVNDTSITELYPR